MRVLAILACSLAVSGCGLVYKIDVQQGNYVTRDLVAKLKPGMTKTEVRQLLGTPLLSDVFHADRWDYYYSSEKGGKRQDQKRLTVLFKDDKVVSFAGEAHPPPAPPIGPQRPLAPATAAPAPAAPEAAPATPPAPAAR